jgi:hypothetical protein
LYEGAKYVAAKRVRGFDRKNEGTKYVGGLKTNFGKSKKFFIC